MRKRMIWTGVLTVAALGTVARAAPIPITAAGQYGIYSTDGSIGTGNAGVPYVGDSGNGKGYLVRTIVTFQLTPLPAGQTVGSASLQIWYSSKTGTPVGDAQLYALPNVNNTAYDKTDFEATPANQVTTTATPFLTPSSTPSGQSGQYYMVDVTAAVQADYQNDPSGSRVSTFRIEIPSDAGGTTEAGNYYNLNPGATHPSILSITAVPEPAGLGLLALGGWMLARRRAR